MPMHRAYGAVAKDKEKWSGALDLNSETKISENISESACDWASMVSRNVFARGARAPHPDTGSLPMLNSNQGVGVGQALRTHKLK